MSPRRSVDQRGLWISLAVWLAMATAFLIWFDYAAATAIFHPQPDLVGNIRYQVPGFQNTVYPFTYVGVAASVLGVAIFIYLKERPQLGILLAVLLGLVVGNLASIGMINCYEQVFVGLRWFTGFGHGDSVYWMGLYWGNYQEAGMTLAGMIPVLAILPWARWRNWPGISLCLGVYAISMGIWFFHGYPDPQNGDALDYWMNGVSRIASQLALVAAISTQDPLRLLVARFRSYRTRPTAPEKPASIPGSSPQPPNSAASD